MRALGLALAALLAAPARVADEQADLQARLEEERALFQLLKAGTKDVLGTLDQLERAARASAARAKAFEAQAAAVRLQAEVARAEEARAQGAQAELERAVAPRLLALYRLGRQDRLTVLLSAADFASLVRQDRALRALVQRDVEALDELAALGRYTERRTRALEQVEDVAQALALAAREEQAVAKARRAELDELVGKLALSAERVSRVVRELEEQERELARMVAELESEGGESSLRSRKGQLPFPTDGLVEVGFGKVVNPRFNTVTVQKGIDVRARLGAKVVSVAPGTVAYAQWLKGYGNLVIVDHGGGYHSLYAHLAHALVEVGNEVEEGEEIGAVGDTGSLKGPYLYFELRRRGDAVDPLPWFDPAGVR